jgi:hypothetical protein
MPKEFASAMLVIVSDEQFRGICVILGINFQCTMAIRGIIQFGGYDHRRILQLIPSGFVNN